MNRFVTGRRRRRGGRRRGAQNECFWNNSELQFGRNLAWRYFLTL